MGNSFSTNAIVFSIKASGENNSSVCFFTEDEGIVYGTMYGGPKSKLKSLVSPWNAGTAYFSESNKSSGLKISDFEVKKYHLTFREDLYKNIAASLAAEIIIKTKCGGSIDKCWYLLNGFLDGLELCTTQEQCQLGLYRFLWRYLELMGINPDLETCSHCGNLILTGKTGNSDLSYRRIFNYFLPYEGALVCNSCWSSNYQQLQNYFVVSKEATEYLKGITSLRPSDSRKISLSKESTLEIRSLVFYLIENACGQPLKSLQTGALIL